MFEPRKGRVKIQNIDPTFHEQDYQRLAGVDEAGRGALAGPVVAAAVILPVDIVIPGVTDSKQLTPKKRDRLFDEIQDAAVAIGVGCVHHDAIDRTNILRATMLAMSQAVLQLDPFPDYAIVDGIDLPSLILPAQAIPKGDSLSQSIAAASIIAKVTRDRMMIELDETYPQYGFARHKGYGTLQHRQAVAQFGRCPIHRRSFQIRVSS